jgi:hypothetical protein
MPAMLLDPRTPTAGTWDIEIAWCGPARLEPPVRLWDRDAMGARHPGGGGRVLAIAWLWALGGCPRPATEPAPDPSPETAAAAAGPRFLKGQLHLHSNASGDSETPPADVVRWYADAGFDFIVFTDHNRITEHAGHDGMLVFPGVELTQNLEQCEPPPEPSLQCLLHVNALFVDPQRVDAVTTLPRPTSAGRAAVYTHAIETAHALHGLAMLNHPNFHYAADAALLTELAGEGLRLFEVANEAVDSNNAGDGAHPSTEALWDAVLGQGHRLYGIATDDAHHYDDADAVRARGGLAHVGNRGFVMVRAEHNQAAIRAALERGEFYASNGLVLSDVRRDRDRLIVEAPASVTVTFIGEGGRTLATSSGTSASLDLATVESGYVRARVVDANGRTAWVQPHWRR